MPESDWLKNLAKALEEAGEQSGSQDSQDQPGPTQGVGTGQFAQQLAGRTLRQFTSGSLGGSTEKILILDAGGRCMYREISQYDGGRVATDPEYGTWSASGDFPTGQLNLTWAGSGTTAHVIEYHGGDSCILDGVQTRVS